MTEQAPHYPKGDFRRTLSVLAAIDSLQPATLVKIVERTGIDKKTVTSLIEQARVQIGVGISKNGAVYAIEDWGPVIKKTGARMALTGALNAPTIEE
jgi:hypothetical protein